MLRSGQEHDERSDWRNAAARRRHRDQSGPDHRDHPDAALPARRRLKPRVHGRLGGGHRVLGVAVLRAVQRRRLRLQLGPLDGSVVDEGRGRCAVDPVGWQAVAVASTHGETASLPGWMQAVDKINAARATGLGFLLCAVNPKNLGLSIGAGVQIAEANLSPADTAIAVLVFVLIASASVVLPVLAYAVAKDRMRHPLDELHEWLVQNNATVMTILLTVMGAVVLGQGVGGPRRLTSRRSMTGRTAQPSPKAWRRLASSSSDRLVWISSISWPAKAPPHLVERRRRYDMHEQCRRAGRDLVADVFDEVIADADVGQRAAQGAGRGADRQSEQRHEEDQPEQEAPEGATHRAGAGEAGELLGLRLLLALRPRDSRGVVDLDELLLGKLEQASARPVRRLRRCRTSKRSMSPSRSASLAQVDPGLRRRPRMRRSCGLGVVRSAAGSETPVVLQVAGPAALA